MAGEKIDFLMTINGKSEAVKARIFEGENGEVFVRLDCSIFRDVNINLLDLDPVIAVLHEVREAARKVADAKST